ncbi:hypothetical protein [uncultured Adlercreutzia sp.]|uniref:baeRF8 domain-containing protein n=1 Tax=uncultured Adlercreutzia sp. TaxID=875803 RepID=UPI0025D058CE|nr:hypothetical protein [uncultured Adlercreutzia sp.]
MKDEKETQRLTDESIHVMEGFDPSILENVTAPVVSLYIPVHHTERDERRAEWDADMFKDLMKDAERTLAESYDKDAYKGIEKRAKYLLDHADMPLWLHAGEGLGFLMNNDAVYVYNLSFAPDPMVAAGETYFVKPLLRNFQYGTEYYVLELGNDRFSWVKGDRTHATRQQLPKEVHDYFSELFADSDETEADVRKHEEGALDFVSLEGHDSQYHDRKSRNEVKKEDAQQWFRYVNKAVDDYLVRDDTTPIILCCDPEYVNEFRKISTLRHLLPVGIEKDPAGLNGKELLEAALGVMDGIRDANIKQAAEEFAGDAAHNKASDDWDNIGMALAERRVKALFMVKGKVLPGGFDINTGTVTFDPNANPVDDGYIDPAAPDITDAFAKAALAQDAHIYIVEQDQMPTDQPIAALYRYAE